MTARDVLRQQFALVYRVAEANASGLTHEDSLRQPSPGGNCSNWILGHMVGAHNSVMRLLGEEPVWEDESLARAATEPITERHQAIPWETLCERFITSRDRCLAAIEGLTDEQLGEGGFTDPFGDACTRGELLSLLAFHQTYHAGQLGLSRRLAGHPGVIRAPQS
jgi:uncharacterized damage-inducible protein DinB